MRTAMNTRVYGKWQGQAAAAVTRLMARYCLPNQQPLGVGVIVFSGPGRSALAIAIPAAGFLVRLFMIQHDCGHGTLFRHRK